MLKKNRIFVSANKLFVALIVIPSMAVVSFGFDYSSANAASFDIKKLPVGKNVTLLRPATTLVPMAVKTKLAATDVPQTVSFKAIWKGKGKNKYSARKIKLAIYDADQSRVRYVDIKQGIPFLYSFKGLTSIVVIPESANGSSFAKGAKNLSLQIESDKPLSIGR